MNDLGSSVCTPTVALLTRKRVKNFGIGETFFHPPYAGLLKSSLETTSQTFLLTTNISKQLSEHTLAVSKPCRIFCLTHKILELVPANCKVFVGAGDERSISRQIVYDRYRHELTREYVDGWQQTPWVPVPYESVESILRNAVDCPGTKRMFGMRRQPDLQMPWIEAGEKLSDTVPDCEIGWISSRPDVADVERAGRANKPIEADLAKFGYLFDLPIELRMRIYDLVLAPEGCVRLHNSCSGLTPPLLDLLQTCKRIYSEAREIPFSSNTFICEDVTGFILRNIPKVSPRVRRLTILLHIHARVEDVMKISRSIYWSFRLCNTFV